jgi:D-tagatose-1,6-bisphosphate aldolase subunit GatZ/KbaZ
MRTPYREHMATSILKEIIQHQKQGKPRGIYAACTANAYAIRAVLQQAARNGTVALVESTANQVNPAGGYSGLTPVQFRHQVLQMATEIGIPPHRVILGGDHIGPHPWRHEDADRALQKASGLVRACVGAGYRKIHLDTTTPCGNDPRQADGALPLEIVSRRTADLCRVAEQTARKKGIAPPWYVIGSDVPPPGGGDMAMGAAPVTHVRNLRDYVAACRRTFEAEGLEAAWQRVLALVVQTGAEFSPVAVQPYDTDRMQPLVTYIRQAKSLVLEAHSTDYQAPNALARMVTDHVGILKVGPALTYAMREALFVLADIEKEMLGGRKSIQCSYLPETMERLMMADPGYWQLYYQGTEKAMARLRRNAYSDRIRYYWACPEAAAALHRLIMNLRQHAAPLSLIADRLPDTGKKIRAGNLANDPESIVLDHIAVVTAMYARACHPVSS